MKRTHLNNNNGTQSNQTVEAKKVGQNKGQTQINAQAQLQKIFKDKQSDVLTAFDNNINYESQMNDIGQFCKSVDKQKKIQEMQKKNLSQNESNLFYNPSSNPINYLEKNANETLKLGKLMMSNGQMKNRSYSISDQKDDLLLFYKYKSGFNKQPGSSIERMTYDQHLQQIQMKEQKKKVVGDMYQKNNSLSPKPNLKYKQANIQNNPKYIIALNPSPPQNKVIVTKKKKKKIQMKNTIIPNSSPKQQKLKEHLLTQNTQTSTITEEDRIIDRNPTQFFHQRQYKLNQLNLPIQGNSDDNSYKNDQLISLQINKNDSNASLIQLRTEPNQTQKNEFNSNILNTSLTYKDYYNPEQIFTIDEANVHKNSIDMNLPNINYSQQQKNILSSPLLQTIEGQKSQNISQQKLNICRSSTIQIQDQSIISNHSLSPLKRGNSHLIENKLLQNKGSLVNLDMLEKDLIDIQKQYTSNSPIKRQISYENSPIKSQNTEQRHFQPTQKWLKKSSIYTILPDENSYSPEKTIDEENKLKISSSRNILDTSSISPTSSPRRLKSLATQDRIIPNNINKSILKNTQSNSQLQDSNQIQHNSLQQSPSLHPHNSSNRILSTDISQKFSKSSHIQQFQIKPQKLQDVQSQLYHNKSLDLNLPYNSKQQNTLQQNDLQEGYGVSLVTQFQHLQNKRVGIKQFDGDISENEDEDEFNQKDEISSMDFSTVEDYKIKGLLKDRYFIKYHKQILDIIQENEKDGISKKQSQGLLNLIYRAKKYENFTELMKGCEDFKNELNNLDQDLKEQTESIEQRKDNLAQILEILNEVQDCNPKNEKDYIKMRLKEIKSVKNETIQNTKQYIQEMNDLKSQEKQYSLSGLDKRKFLQNNLDKIKKQRQKLTLKACKTEHQE